MRSSRPIRRLKRVRVDEISLVDEPAFKESRPLIFKSASALKGIAFADDPAHPWLSLEALTDDDGISVLATAIVLQAGDPEEGGGTWTMEEVQALHAQWAALLSEPGHVNRWRMILNADGSVNTDTEIVSWGLTGDKGGLDLYGMDDDADPAIPPNSWFVQVFIDGPTVGDLLSDAPALNGLAPLDALVLAKAGDDQDDWGGPDDDPDDLLAGAIAEVSEQLADDAPDPDDLSTFTAPDPGPDSLGLREVEGALILKQQARRQAMDNLGARIGQAVVKKLVDQANTVDPVALGEELAKVTAQVIDQLPEG